mmetsp:Transcript_71881/g.120534  ORF Transcript_71881/g.120534 Transcript_71881/m.120534 type:complete len:214 (-) Transcript_71881:2229-2870(-)
MGEPNQLLERTLRQQASVCRKHTHPANPPLSVPKLPAAGISVRRQAPSRGTETRPALDFYPCACGPKRRRFLTGAYFLAQYSTVLSSEAKRRSTNLALMTMVSHVWLTVFLTVSYNDFVSQNARTSSAFSLVTKPAPEMRTMDVKSIIDVAPRRASRRGNCSLTQLNVSSADSFPEDTIPIGIHIKSWDFTSSLRHHCNASFCTGTEAPAMQL